MREGGGGSGGVPLRTRKTARRCGGCWEGGTARLNLYSCAMHESRSDPRSLTPDVDPQIAEKAEIPYNSAHAQAGEILDVKPTPVVKPHEKLPEL